MLTTAHNQKRSCDSALCIGMVLVTSAVAVALIVYSSATVLLLLR